MQKLLKKREITHRITSPGNMFRNGVAERMNGKLHEIVRVILWYRMLPKSF